MAARPRHAHHHAAGVAFRGNAHAVFEGRFARLIRVGQRCGVDVDHYLMALAGAAGIDTVMEGRFREQGQRVGLLLGQRGRFL